MLLTTKCDSSNDESIIAWAPFRRIVMARDEKIDKLTDLLVKLQELCEQGRKMAESTHSSESTKIRHKVASPTNDSAV